MVTLPTGVYGKYDEFATEMLNQSTGFGVQCQLVYTSYECSEYQS